jgi:hypothetical protein
MRIGRPVPSHDVIGIENVTGMTPQPSCAPQMLRNDPATAVAPAPAVQVLWPMIDARNVLNVRWPEA